MRDKFKYLAIGVLPLFFYYTSSLVWLIPFIFQSHTLISLVKIILAIAFLTLWASIAYEFERQEPLDPIDYALAHLFGAVLIVVTLILPMNSLSEVYYVTLNNAFTPNRPTLISMIFSLVIMLIVFVSASKVSKRKQNRSR